MSYYQCIPVFLLFSRSSWNFLCLALHYVMEWEGGVSIVLLFDWLLSSLFFSASGPAEVPMMSPNGSIPPIHVPPGYVSQVTGRNGSGPCVRVAKPLPHNEDVISPLIGEYPFLGNTFTKCDSSMQQPNKQQKNRRKIPSCSSLRNGVRTEFA